MRFLLATLAVGCTFSADDTTEDTDTTDDADDCVDPHLEWWCFHSEGDLGPVVPDTGMATCPTPDLDNACSEPCGAYTVMSESGGFSGVEHYFLDGEHVATKHWTDVNVYCGGFDFWYGEKIECP